MYFRRFGLLLAAALAGTALFASAALANETTDGFTAPTFKYPATITGTAALGETTINIQGLTATCEITWSGKLEGVSQELELTPTYANCEAFGFQGAKVEMDPECRFRYRIFTKAAAGKYEANTDLLCPFGGGGLTITTSTCEVQIPQQNLITVADFENLLSGLDMADTPIENVNYTVKKDGLLCPLGGVGEKVGAKFESDEATLIWSENGLDIG